MPWACAAVAAPRLAITLAARASVGSFFIASPVVWGWEGATLGGVPRNFLDGIAGRGARLVKKVSCRSTPSQRKALRLRAGQLAQSCCSQSLRFAVREL